VGDVGLYPGPELDVQHPLLLEGQPEQFGPLDVLFGAVEQVLDLLELAVVLLLGLAAVGLVL